MFLVNSRQPRFAATSLSSGREVHHLRRHTLSRSYGVILQSSLTTVISSALVYSTHPPVSVSGTDNLNSPRGAFLGSMESASNAASEDLAPHHASVLMDSRLILGIPPIRFDKDVQNLAGTVSFSVTPRFKKLKLVQEY